MKTPPHPGRVLKGELEAIPVPVAAAAKALGVTRQHLHRLIAGDSDITPEMAYRLEQGIGSTAELWVSLQAAYDLALIRQRSDTITVRKLARLEPA